MIHLGDKKIEDIYLGDKPISKIYQGEKLVYEKVYPNGFTIINSESGQLTFAYNNNPITGYVERKQITVEAFIPKKVGIGEITSIASLFLAYNHITYLDVTNIDVSKCTSFRSVFDTCESLISIEGLSNWDTSKVTDMANMFHTCKALESLDLSNWDTSKVTDMELIFGGCSSLKSLDLSNWDISNLKVVSMMFESCDSLTHIKCRQAFKDWCIANQSKMFLPSKMREGGSGTWEIVA